MHAKKKRAEKEPWSWDGGSLWQDVRPEVEKNTIDEYIQ
jgi:hypothetical protein